MQAAITFEAAKRETAGKGSARALRRAGKVPAIVYGELKENVSIAIEEKDVVREYFKGGFFNKLVEVKLGSESYHVLPRDVQLHPVSDKVEHVDFLKVTDESTVTVKVPVRYINRERSKGIKRGGALNIVRHDVELVCNVNHIPSFLEVDLLEVNIGDSVHISSVTLPEGVKSSIDRDFTLAAITGRGKKDEEETAAAEGAEAGEESATKGEKKEEKKAE